MTEEKDLSVISLFQSLGDTPEKLRLFNRGAATGYFVLGTWAVRISQQYIKSSAVVKNWSSSPHTQLHAVVVNEALSREIIRDCLLHLGVAVEVYDRRAGSSSSLYLAQQGTPGNIADFEATLFDFNDAEIQLTCCGAAVFQITSGSHLRIGVANLNSTMRSIQVSEFDDVPQLVNLDAQIAQSNIKELLIPANALSGDFEAALKRVCERGNVTMTVLPKKAFSSVDVQRRLGDVLRVPEEKMLLVDIPLAASAVGCLLDHAKLGGDGTFDQSSFNLKHITPTNFLKLDAAAIHALNIVAQGQQETRGGGSSNKIPTTIYAWLDRCSTGMGSRLMRQWLLQPLRDVDAIADRHSLLEIMIEAPVVRDSLLTQVLRRCGDMDKLNRKLQRRTISLKEIYTYLNFQAAVSGAVKCLKLYSGHHSKLLNDEVIIPLEELSHHLEKLRLLIDYTIDTADRDARIKPEFDDDLQELDTQRAAVIAHIDKEHAATMRKYGWTDKQLKCELHPSYGYTFRVSRKDDQQVRENKQLTTITTAKDGVRFFSDKLAALNEQHRTVNKAYQTRQLELKSKLVETVSTYLPVLDDSKEILAQLDVFVAWSIVVKDSKNPMVRPTMLAAAKGGISEDESTVATVDNSSKAGVLVALHGVRHPLVELRQPDFRPNSVKLMNGTAGPNAYLITGPNMGGKSTLMRSVGVAVVMAQAGCFVCAESAVITVRDSVMCRVGATDYMSQGVSTFMVEMLESAAILSTATQNSLVIVDELGRGTSTYDGFGLAWAIADHIANTLRAALLFSTHFHEMTDMQEVCPRTVCNMHFGAESAADGSLRFTYKLEPGPSERSYGIYVAELARLPIDVIAEAKRKADELESFAGKTEQWRRVKLDETIQTRVAEYVRRMQSACDGGGDPSTIQALRDEILKDEPVAQILLGSAVL